MIFTDASSSQGRNKVQRIEDHNINHSAHYSGHNIVPGYPSPHPVFHSPNSYPILRHPGPVNSHPHQEMGLNPHAGNSVGDIHRPIINSPGRANYSPGPGNHSPGSGNHSPGSEIQYPFNHDYFLDLDKWDNSGRKI